MAENSQIEIGGMAQPRFAAVKQVFARNFADGEELGARFTLVEAGEVVLDLWAGHADRDETKPFDQTTLTPIFSTTKALAATMIARLVDQGKLSYQQTVASVWPEFGQAGKDRLTIEQAMSHQAGLSGFPEPMDPSEWFDWDAICNRLAAMTPMWPPGTASGYHPSTIGYITGEIFRRVDGRMMADAFREDVAGPAGLDIWIGLPDEQAGRVAELQRPSRLPNFGEINVPTKAAFLNGWSSAGTGHHQQEWRKLPVPSANGHATAHSLARLAGALADGGDLDGLKVLSPPMIAEAARERIVARTWCCPS
jgi:CubicO group peptidase (beta-lactamase class C family)